jgi:starvation-inducible DNA-binding protein
MSDSAGPRVAEDELQGQLRDLLCLAIVGDHVRWVLTGAGGAELAEWLTAASDAWRTWADEVAKQLVASGIAPDGRIRSLAKDIPVNWVPPGWLEAAAARALLADRLATVSEWARYRRSQSDGARAESLDVICSGFGEQLRALAER